MQRETEFKYDIFISYKHEVTDKKVAGFLQKSLENYKIPKEIQKKTGKTKIKRVFRDEEELSIASNLGEEIENQLKQTEFLLVVCSRKTKESIWVQREIETFLKYRSRRNILPVLIDGEPEESFPQIIIQGGEPLAADLRGKNDKEILKNAKKELVRIVAPVLKCSYDELKQRHKTYQMKRMAFLAGSVAVAAILFGAYCVKQNLEIQKNYREMKINQSRYLAQISEELLESGNREAAMLVALEALPESEEDEDRPFVVEAYNALKNSLYLYRQPWGSHVYPHKKIANSTSLTDKIEYSEKNDQILTIDTNGTIYIRDAQTLELVQKFSEKTWENAVFNSDGNVIAEAENYISCMDLESGEIIWEKEAEQGYSFLEDWDYDKQTNKLAVASRSLLCDGETQEYYYSYKTDIMDAGTGESDSWEFQRNDDDMRLKEICLSPGNEYIALWFHNLSITSENAANEFAVYRLSDKQCFFTQQMSGWLPGTIQWIDEHTFAAVVKEEYGGVVGMECAWKITSWDVLNQQERWSYEDASLNLNDYQSLQVWETANHEGESEQVVSVISNNVHVVLDLVSGALVNRMEDHNMIEKVFLLSNSSGVIYIMQTGEAYLSPVYETYTGNPLWMDYNYELGIDNIEEAYTKNGNLYLIENENLYLYRPIESEFGEELEDTQNVSTVVFTDNQEYFYCDTSTQISLFKTDTGELVWKDTCANYKSESRCFAGENILAYVSDDQKVLKLYDMESGEIATIELTDQNYMSHTVFYCGNQRLLIWNNKEIFLVDTEKAVIEEKWDTQWLREVFEANGEDVGYIPWSTIVMTEDQRFLIILDGSENQITIWDRKEKCLKDLPECKDKMLAEWYGYNQCPDRKMLNGNTIILYGKDAVIRIYDIENSEILSEIETDGVGGYYIVFTPDGEHILFMNASQQLRVVNWKTKEVTMFPLDRLNKMGYAEFEFSEDGERLFVKSKQSMSTPVMHLYEKSGDGVYEEKTSVSFCYGTDGEHVIVQEDEERNAIFADVYSLNELIAMAEKELNGRELTEEERYQYMIEE